MKCKKRIGVSIILALCMVFTLIPGSVFAQDNNIITFSEFIEDLEADGKFDGGGATVKWEPDENVNVIHRIQNNNAQYQILSGKDVDLEISNARFEYVPADIPNHSDGWSGINKDYTKDEIRNAEFQFLNSGNVSVTNCTFEKIIVSPYGPGDDKDINADRNTAITGCSFSNVYNAYALKDIYTGNAVIEDNIFSNCSGAIYFEGSVSRSNLEITGNTFDTIDKYAAAGKENTRGIIQFSSRCAVDENTEFTFADNTITGNLIKDEVIGDSNAVMPVIRQFSNLGKIIVNGWIPGEAFSIKLDAEEDDLTLPDMPSGIVNDVQYDFMGWADTSAYAGAEDITNETQFLNAGDAGKAGQFYYAVWKATPKQTAETTEPSVPGATNGNNDNGQGHDAGKAVQTGDTFNMIPWIALMCAAGIGALSLILFSRKKGNKADH